MTKTLPSSQGRRLQFRRRATQQSQNSMRLQYRNHHLKVIDFIAHSDATKNLGCLYLQLIH